MRLARVHGRIGTGGFNIANRWDSNADVGPQGSTNMTRICVFSPVRLLSSNSQDIFNKSNVGANIGWVLRWRNTQTYYFFINDGGGTFRNASVSPTVIPKEGDCIVWIGSYDETELICYAKGELAISGPWVGFKQINEDITIGATTGGANPALDFIVLACLATDTYALSLSECIAAEAILKTVLEQGQRIDPLRLPGSGWNWIWDARNINHAKGEWADDVSGVVLYEQGKTQKYFVKPRFA